MAGNGFYTSSSRSRNTTLGVHGSALEQKLDKIFEGLKEQNNQVLGSLRDNAEKTLESIKGLDDRLSKLENKVDCIEQATLSSGDEKVKKERSRIPPKLSEDVKLLYQKLDQEHQFDPTALYRSPHNSRVKEYMCEQLEVNGKEFTPHQVKKAVHRYYESRRRIQFTDKKPERVDIVKENKRKSRLAQGQRRLFQSRSDCVKECEKKFWEKISFICMSEESAAEDENGEKYIIRHTPSWRSDDLNSLIAKLDKRLLKVDKKKGKHFKRLRRESGSVVNVNPPDNIPKWALNPAYQSPGTSMELESSCVVAASRLPSESSEIDSDFAIDGEL